MYLDHCELIPAGGDLVIVLGPCSVTGKPYQTRPVTRQAVIEYRRGASAEAAFPELSDEERGFLIDGTTFEGWEQLAVKEDE